MPGLENRPLPRRTHFNKNVVAVIFSSEVFVVLLAMVSHAGLSEDKRKRFQTDLGSADVCV